ncbi:MAG: hypothetical protein Q9191_003347, partial [Dirinaria sp. TL-2023a]
MQVVSDRQVPRGIEPQRLTIMLPMGQDMRKMSFSKEQQNAAAARRGVKSKARRSGNDYRPAQELCTLKAANLTNVKPPQSEVTGPKSSGSQLPTKPDSRRFSTDKVRELNWRDMEIPSELDLLHAGTPIEIQNIIQESLDEHRAKRAARQSQPQAIIVRTTITQSRSSETVGNLTALTESSASATSRRANSSISSNVPSAHSLDLESTSSLNTSGGRSGLLKPPSLYDEPGFTVCQEDMLAEAGMKIMKARQRRSRDKPLKERGFFKIFSNWKGKEVDRRGLDEDGSHFGEYDQRRREEEIQQRHQRYDAGGAAEEAEVRAAIAAVEAAERSVAQEREAEEERFAEEARMITAREYERLEAITEFFEYLREALERVRVQQMQAMERRHRTKLEEIYDKENALVSGERMLHRDQKAAAERVKLVKDNEETMKHLRKKHADELIETLQRHRDDQHAYILRSTESPTTDERVDQGRILKILLQAQDSERAILRSQQARTIQKYEKRAPRLLEDFDRRTEAERTKLLENQIKEAEEVTRVTTETKTQTAADWKWFDAIFLDRAMMLGEDERRMVLSGADA